MRVKKISTLQVKHATSGTRSKTQNWTQNLPALSSQLRKVPPHRSNATAAVILGTAANHVNQASAASQSQATKVPQPPPGHQCRAPLTARLQLASPVGRLLLEACPAGLHRLAMADPEAARPCAQQQPQRGAAVAVLSGDPVGSPAAVETLAWLAAYFADVGGAVTADQLPPGLPPICCTAAGPAGSFRDRVWRALPLAAPLGATVSYRDLGVLAGAGPNAARAVGAAMRNNPVPLLVPCHRVVCASGALGHFAGGKADATKRWLLWREGGLPAGEMTG